MADLKAISSGTHNASAAPRQHGYTANSLMSVHKLTKCLQYASKGCQRHRMQWRCQPQSAAELLCGRPSKVDVNIKASKLTSVISRHSFALHAAKKALSS